MQQQSTALGRNGVLQIDSEHYPSDPCLLDHKSPNYGSALKSVNLETIKNYSNHRHFDLKFRTPEELSLGHFARDYFNLMQWIMASKVTGLGITGLIQYEVSKGKFEHVKFGDPN
jgi:hypothetical protein